MSGKDERSRSLERYPTLESAHERIRALEEQVAELKRLAFYDATTSLLNKRSFDNAIESIAKRPFGGIIGIVWVDIDNFKELNDTLGYLKANEVLERVATILKDHLRHEIDEAYRFGGDEMVVIVDPNDWRGFSDNSVHRRALPSEVNFEIEELRKIVGRLRRAVKEERWELQNVTPTVSIGYALGHYSPGNSADVILHVIEAANAALKRAKQGGRNRAEGSVQIFDVS